MLCGVATAAPQLLLCTAAPQTFLISGHLLLKHLISVGPKNENIPTTFFSCNCMREGCTSAARGCTTSAQEILQSRNIYRCRRHWSSVLITVAWAGDQDMAHILPLPGGIKVRKQSMSLGIKLWKEGLRGGFPSHVPILYA